MPNFPNMQGGIVPDAENMQIEKGGFGRGMSSSDVKLQYIDDNIDSYPNIWNNAKTNINKADQMRLIKSIQKLTNGRNRLGGKIEQVILFLWCIITSAMEIVTPEIWCITITYMKRMVR